MSTILILGMNSPLLILKGYGETSTGTGIKIKLFDLPAIRLRDQEIKIFDDAVLKLED